jgi:hypothetical protein
MRWIRSFLLALLVSLLVGFAIGTWLRLRMEQRPVYIGHDLRSEPTRPVELTVPRGPNRHDAGGGRG